MSPIKKINPRFRQITDLLFFSDRMDLDLSDFKFLLKNDYKENISYVWDRFLKSSQIFWEEGDKFWAHRLTFLFSLNDNSLIEKITDYIESRMFSLIKTKKEINPQYDIEYLQFLEYCKVKRNQKENMFSIRSRLVQLTSNTNIDKLFGIISHCIPTVFRNMDEYADLLIQKIPISAYNFDVLLALEQRGFVFDKYPIVKLAQELISKRNPSFRNGIAFLTIINDATIRDSLKKEYNISCRDKLLNLLQECEFKLLEAHHLRNIKNLLDLDAGIADDFAAIYVNKLYSRKVKHKKSNIDKLIRLIKEIPQISAKKILACLSGKNKSSDIKYMLLSFPELKKLAIFI